MLALVPIAGAQLQPKPSQNPEKGAVHEHALRQVEHKVAAALFAELGDECPEINARGEIGPTDNPDQEHFSPAHTNILADGVFMPFRRRSAPASAAPPAIHPGSSIRAEGCTGTAGPLRERVQPRCSAAPGARPCRAHKG